MADAFLPDGYKEPNTSKYMKFEEGKNKFRVLPGKPGKPAIIMGWEYWKTEDGKRKVYRVHKEDEIPVGDIEVNPKTGEPDLPKFFWAFAVWNWKTEGVQILEVKQKTIRDSIKDLTTSDEWGAPFDYDITVNQKIEGGKTSYTVSPNPKSPISTPVLEKYDRTPLDLEALYRGGDPFALNQTDDLSDDELEDIADAVPA